MSAATKQSAYIFAAVGLGLGGPASDKLNAAGTTVARPGHRPPSKAALTSFHVHVLRRASCTVRFWTFSFEQFIIMKELPLPFPLLIAASGSKCKVLQPATFHWQRHAQEATSTHPPPHPKRNPHGSSSPVRPMLNKEHEYR